MKRLICILFVFSILCFTACNRTNNQNTINELLPNNNKQIEKSKETIQNIFPGDVYEFRPGYYYILDSSVNIYSEPDLGSQIIDRIELNEQIEILETTEEIMKINSIFAYWYKIKYKDNTGYIWGGNIAVNTLKIDIDENGINDFFHFRYERLQEFQGIINAVNDIYIYINDNRISTKELQPDQAMYCNFEYNGIDVILKLRDHGKIEYIENDSYVIVNYYTFRINKNGEIIFMEKVIEQNEYL